MKKLIFFLVAVVAMALASCEKAPEFCYDLSVEGQVSSASAPVYSTFNAAVTNDTLYQFVKVNDSVDVKFLQDLPQESKIVKDFDTYVQNAYIDKLVAANSDAKYKIVIKGFISESMTGVKIQVDKTFTNIDGKQVSYYNEVKL